MNARTASVLGWLLVACAGAPSEAPRTPPAAPTVAVQAPVAAPASASSASAASAASVAPPAAAEPTLPAEVVKVLDVPVTAIGIGEGTRVGVLAEQPYVGDAKGLKAMPLPAGLQPKADDVDRLGIYFGRDNEPRVMGTRTSAAGERAVYWRHLPNGWRDGREEIGQLGGAVPLGLWGVLGSADPELVCRVNSLCIIKRVSGWTLAPAGANARLVVLQEGTLWGLDASGIASIDKRGWATAIAAPSAWAPVAFWATAGEAWVSTASALWHHRDGKWQSVPSPVGPVSALWGARRDSIWIAGAKGAAHYDGERFRALPLSEPLRAVRGRSDREVWFGGSTGLWRVKLGE